MRIADEQLVAIETSATRAIAADDDHDDVRARARGEYHDDAQPEVMLALIAELRELRECLRLAMAMWACWRAGAAAGSVEATAEWKRCGAALDGE